MLAISWLLDQHYEVFSNVVGIGPADLVAWKPGDDPVLVDVKSRTNGDFSPSGVHARASDEAGQVRLLLHDPKNGFRWDMRRIG